MKLTYRRCGDYYLPNIGIPEEDMRPLGKYGRMRMRYLREHRSLLFNQLLLSGKLMKHLYSIDDACQERLDLLIPQMKAAEGVTEDLKAADQMEWVVNQKAYLTSYAADHGFAHCRHYTDDGFSGGNFERPGWKQLIADIDAGLVGVVIAKDLSRVGRDYIQTGFYTEVYQTILPVPLAIGSSFNPALAEQVASVAAREASATGLHVTFAPMIDLSRDSRWGRCMESTGEDPWLNARMAESMVRGFQGDNIAQKGKMASCIKHFAAYGAVQAGRDYNVTELSEHTLFEDYLVSYRAAVKAGASMVMTAFNTIDRKPCTTNRRLLRDILREDMGFDGVVISDFSALRETINFGTSRDHADAAKQGMLAGCDIEMMSECYLHHLAELVQRGEIPEMLVDEAVMRILRLKNNLGLFENPYKDASVEDEKRLIFCEEHQALSRAVAEECIVLLKNDGLLPLSDKQKIVVVGALAEDREITGSWALFADWDQTITMRKGIETLYPQADVTFFASDDVTDNMLAAAKTADVVIMALGENQRPSGESQSKADISLPKAHTALFNAVHAVNPRIVTVLFGGRPLAVPELAAKTNALVEAWLPGSCGCYALADILFGKVNPSGRLSMSMPYCTGQLPMSYGANLTGRPKPEKNGFFVFTSNYLDVPNEPLYPFGYGLSYGEVAYSSVTLDSAVLRKGGQLTASVIIENRCDLPVKEAVQLYIQDVHGSVIRPERELKGLQKVSLQPGESCQVSFSITEDMLRLYDADMNFVSEPGDFRIWIGHDSMTDNSAVFQLQD